MSEPCRCDNGSGAPCELTMTQEDGLCDRCRATACGVRVELPSPRVEWHEDGTATLIYGPDMLIILPPGAQPW